MIVKIKSFTKNIGNKLKKLNIKIISKNNFLEKILFYTGFICATLFFYDDFSNLINFNPTTLKNLKMISTELLLLKIILTKENIFSYIKYLLLISLAVIVNKVTGDDGKLPFCILIIIASKKIDINDIIKLLYKMNIAVILLHVLVYSLNYFNIFELKIFESLIYRNDQIRHSFFFYHPNTFSNYLFWTYIMYIYLNFYNKKLYKKIIAIGIFLMGFVYLFPNSRTACLFFIISMIFLFIYNNKKIYSSNIFEILNILFFSICFGFSFFCLFNYGQNNIINELLQKLDRNLLMRVYTGKHFLVEYGFSLFGNFMTMERNFAAIGLPKILLDNWYFYIMIRLGIIISAFFYIIFTKISIHFVQKKDYSKLFVIALFLLYSMIECIGINITWSFVFLFFTLVI